MQAFRECHHARPVGPVFVQLASFLTLSGLLLVERWWWRQEANEASPANRAAPSQWWLRRMAALLLRRFHDEGRRGGDMHSRRSSSCGCAVEWKEEGKTMGLLGEVNVVIIQEPHFLQLHPDCCGFCCGSVPPPPLPLSL